MFGAIRREEDSRLLDLVVISSVIMSHVSIMSAGDSGISRTGTDWKSESSSLSKDRSPGTE